MKKKDSDQCLSDFKDARELHVNKVKYEKIKTVSEGLSSMANSVCYVLSIFKRGLLQMLVNYSLDKCHKETMGCN